MKRSRVGVLISGRGSNMAALVDAARDPACPFAVVLVASDKPDAAGLATARDAGIATAAHAPRGMPKAEYEAAIDASLRDAGVEVIALAGYMRLLSDAFVARWRGRIVNIHPSLLPLYKGLDTHARALAAGDGQAGCSVHLVTEELDGGRVLGQARVPVLPGDTADTLAARVLAEEHRLYPKTLAEFVTMPTPSPADRARRAATVLPEVAEEDDAFAVAGQPFARVSADAVEVLGDDGKWERIGLAGDVDWPMVEDRIARGWELAAPRRLLEAGGR